jgi:MFS transporter, BCD family, chlorophyll transporter
MNWRTILQLAMVHVGVSITVVPVTSTLNRIMIADMQMPALWVSLLIALPYLLSPLQVLLGSWSDQRPIAGRHRSPWIVLGGLMASFGGYFTVHSAYFTAEHYVLGGLTSLVVFAIWGIGVNMASVSYFSLVSELSEQQETLRSRAVSIMMTAMILSTIALALGLAHMLDPFSQEALYMAFGVVWMISTLLVLLGAANLEPATHPALPTQRAGSGNPLAAYRRVSSNPTARRFFLYLLLILISIHAQDVLLEPFGAEALGMPVAMTSRLTSLWGAGLFCTLIGGSWLLRRFDKKRMANLGALVGAAGFLAIILTGLSGQSILFMLSVFLLGLGGGLMTLSNLSFMLDMTVPQAAGLYMGAWGAANFAGQAIGNLISGFLRDLLFYLTGSSIAGYVTVFSLEIAGLLLAVMLFRTISVSDFRREAAIQSREVLALTAD